MATPRKSPPPAPSETALTRYGRTDAARFLGLSIASIKRLEKKGILTPVKDENGVHWHELSELEAYRAERAGMPSPEVEKMVATIDSAASQADKSARHVERTLNIVLAPAEGLLDMYKEECAALRKREGELQVELLTMLTQLREILKEQRAEDIQERELERGARRKDMALNMVKDALPLIAEQLTGKKGATMTDFVRSLHPEQLKLIAASGLLTADQLRAFLALLSSDQRSEIAKPSDTLEEDTQAE